MDNTINKVVVACAIMVEQGRIFGAQRGFGKSNGGFWEFPGGKQEPGESLPATLCRELQEELAITVAVDDEFFCSTAIYGTTTVELHAFFCRILSGTPQLLEHEACRWLLPEEAKKIIWTAADRPILEKLLFSLENEKNC